MKMNNIKKYLGFVILSASLVVTTGCGKEDTSDNNIVDETNNGGKGDTPTGEWVGLCEAREADTVASGKKRFLPDAIRWAIADVEGVTADEFGDDRGQEYGEYFVVTQVPNEAGDAFEEGSVVRGHKSTQLDVDLNDDQKFFLEDEAETVVGKCIFTSWHRDIPGPLPCGADDSCPDIFGQKLDENLFRMQVGFNSNGAASDLVQQCIRKVGAGDYKTGNAEDESDFLHRDFMRGCGVAKDLFGTHWRSSDSQICAVSMRLSECGCTVGGDASADLGFALVPSVRDQMDKGGISFRGFPLGTWSDQKALPTGCEYVDIGTEFGGEPSRTIVACDIRGGDLLQRPEDPKEFCRQQYGEDVVVHVPIPETALECDPPKDGQYAESCSDMPWVVSSPVEEANEESRGE